MRRLVLVTAFVAAGAQAQDGPRFCPNRPSLESSACTTEPGRVHFEFSVADWERDDSADERTDTVLGGDFQLRLGLGPHTEAQLGWTPVGRVRTRDKATGGIERNRRVGDVRLGLRQNLRNPDGKGLSFGLEPFVTLPVGRRPVGAGDWGAGVVLPVTFDLTGTVNIGFTGEVDAAPDADGAGRHLQASGVAAVSVDVTDTLSATLEAELIRDRDPVDPATQAVAGAGLQWKVTSTRALYGEVVAGLNHDSPDLRVYAGLSALF